MLDADLDVSQPKAFHSFQPALTRAQLFSLRVVRYNVACVRISPFTQLTDVMSKISTAGLDKVDFATDDLHEPNGSRIEHAAKTDCAPKFVIPTNLDRRGALPEIGDGPAKGGFPGGHPPQTAHWGTGEPSGNAYHAQTSRPFERIERSGLWDYRPAQTSRRCSASVLAAARLKRRLTQRCNKGCNSKVIIDGPPGKPKRCWEG